MRDLVYEANGKIYKTLKEAPKGAVEKLIDSPREKAKYDPTRIYKLKKKIRWAGATE